MAEQEAAARAEAQQLAEANARLAEQERQARDEAQALARRERQLRQQAQRQTVESMFEHAVSIQQHEGAARGLVALANCLPRAVAAGADDLEHALRLHLAAAYRQIHPLRGIVNTTGGARNIRVNPEGSIALVQSLGDAAYFTVVDLAVLPYSGQRIECPASIEILEFNAEGTLVLVAGVDRTERLWNVAERQFLETTFVHEADITAATFDPDAARIVTGAADGRLRV